MNKLNPIAVPMIRADTSRQSYWLSRAPELNFWQKLGRGVGKAVSFLGPIGAAITAVAVPGFGTAAALGIYGASKLASKATGNALEKDAANVKEANAEIAKQPIGLPGFFDTAQTQASLDTNFIVPSELVSPIQNHVMQREASTMDQVQSY